MNSLQSLASYSLRYSIGRSLSKKSKQCLNCPARQNSSSAATDSEQSNKIKIPKRIERGPTDILKALASTVKKDYSAPHFKYHDDPFLIPTSNMAKRIYAMSQESGRKTAHWIRQEHADLFQHRVADPPIEVYFPKAVYDENSEVDENVLKKVVAQHRVSDALFIYELLEKKNVELTRSMQQELLELLCYFNNEDSLEEEWIEERWFRQDTGRREKKINTWKNGSAAERLFQKMTPADSSSYAALICGKAQFGDINGAYKLFEQALDANLVLPTEVFNKLIAGAHVLKESHDLRWKFVEELMSIMNQYGVSPNLGTLNAILEDISTMSVNKNSKKNALSVLAEFKTMGIEPSLASYYFLLRIFCFDKSSTRSPILLNILNILEGHSLSIRDPRDVLFFREAMEICRFYLSDLDAAMKLDQLLHTGENYNLIGDSYKESVYYRNLFALTCEMGTLEEFMNLYNKLVPNVYVPEPAITEVVINTLGVNEAWELLPKLWSDVVMFEQIDREPILCAMLTVLLKSNSTDSTIVEKHANVALDIWRRVQNQNESKKGRSISWTGPMLGQIVQVLLRGDRYQEAVDIMTYIEKRQQEILGIPTVDSFTSFLDKSIEKGSIKNAMWCVQFCFEAGFEETLHMAIKLNSCGKLSDLDKSVLVNLVGPDAVKEQAVVSN